MSVEKILIVIQEIINDGCAEMQKRQNRLNLLKGIKAKLDEYPAVESIEFKFDGNTLGFSETGIAGFVVEEGGTAVKWDAMESAIDWYSDLLDAILDGLGEFSVTVRAGADDDGIRRPLDDDEAVGHGPTSRGQADDENGRESQHRTR